MTAFSGAVGVLLAVVLMCASFQSLYALRPTAAASLTLRACTESVPAALPSSVAENLLDLNAATREQLIALPGIGEKTAAAILEYRELLGGFRYPEELLQISGIGAGKLDAIYDLIYIER